MKECLFGSYSNNVAGYCTFHCKHVTVKQIRTKECLRKQCHHLMKNEEHQYWTQRAIEKQRKKNARLACNLSK